MSPRVLDVLYIKTIEEEIGRELEVLELEVIEMGEPLFLRNTENELISKVVPTYRFPHDLMVQDIDLALSIENTSFFDFAFNAGQVLSVRRV